MTDAEDADHREQARVIDLARAPFQTQPQHCWTPARASVSPARRAVAYGSSWAELPIYCSVIAFEVDNMHAKQPNELVKDKPVHARLGRVCYLGLPRRPSAPESFCRVKGLPDVPPLVWSDVGV